MQERSFQPATAARFVTDFALTFTRDNGAVVVAVSGELDCATAPILEERLDDLLSAQGNLSIVLDLSDMTFVDSTGLSAFVTAYRHLSERDGSLLLRGPSASTRKILEITGLDRVLPVDDL